MHYLWVRLSFRYVLNGFFCLLFQFDVFLKPCTEVFEYLKYTIHGFCRFPRFVVRGKNKKKKNTSLVGGISSRPFPPVGIFPASLLDGAEVFQLKAITVARKVKRPARVCFSISREQLAQKPIHVPRPAGCSYTNNNRPRDGEKDPATLSRRQKKESKKKKKTGKKKKKI